MRTHVTIGRILRMALIQLNQRSAQTSGRSTAHRYVEYYNLSMHPFRPAEMSLHANRVVKFSVLRLEESPLSEQISLNCQDVPEQKVAVL